MGFEIGAHGLTHRQLTRLPADRRDHEIREAKIRLEQDLGRSVDFFSYPYGDLDPAVMASVQEAGYRGAVATIRGAISSQPEFFALKRMTVLGEPGFEEYLGYLTGSMVSYLDFRDRMRKGRQLAVGSRQ